MGIVIAGFPGIGKSTLFNNAGTILKVTDSDSSLFSWTIVKGEKVRNPEFPANYIKHIKEALANFDIVLVSTHADVRNALDAAKICYALVYPSVDSKLEYIERYAKRGSPAPFLKLMDDKFVDFVKECDDHSYDSDYACAFPLEVGEFLTDVLPSIQETMPDFVEETQWRIDMRKNSFGMLKTLLENQHKV